MHLRNPIIASLFDVVTKPHVIPDETVIEIKKILKELPNVLQQSAQEVAHFTQVRKNYPTLNIQIPTEASINTQDEEGNSLLIWAVRNKHHNIVEALIEAKANLNIKPTMGETALSRAALRGDEVSVKMLIQAQADLNVQHDRNGDTAIILAMKEGHAVIVEMLMEAKANLNKVNFVSETVLGWATYKDKPDISLKLIEAKADPNIQERNGNTALKYAIQDMRHAVVDALLTAKANPNLLTASGGTVLTQALQERRNHEMIDKLLAAKANPNMQDYHRYTPLMHAVSYKNAIVVRKLLAANADPNIVDGNGKTVLMDAIKMDTREIVLELLKHPLIKLDTRDRAGNTAISIALDHTNLPMISLLLTHGAIASNPRALFKFISHCDQRDPEVLRALNALFQQINMLPALKFIDANLFAEIKTYLEKLTKLTELLRNKVVTAVDQATKEKIPKVLVNLMMDYDVPLDANRFPFFKNYDIDQVISNTLKEGKNLQLTEPKAKRARKR